MTVIKPRGAKPELREYSPKRTSILDSLRLQIVSGELAPGMRLPTRRELEKQFAASAETVQRALETLSRDGFVVADGRRGTHVAQHPPHLSQYVLIFRHHPQQDASMWTRFYSALTQEAMVLSRVDSPRIIIRTGVEGHSDNAAFRQLLDDVKAQRLAGIIFADGFGLMEDLPLVQNPQVPVVLHGYTEWPQLDTVRYDFESFFNQALDWLWAKGRRRLAILSHRTPDFTHDVIDRARDMGFRIEEAWVQHMDIEFAFAAQNLMRLLTMASDRPDALLITDDNLVEYATAGLQAAGVKNLDIVAHCNIRHLPPAHMPVRFLGFDGRYLLQESMSCINTRRQGKTPRKLVCIPATWS